MVNGDYSRDYRQTWLYKRTTLQRSLFIILNIVKCVLYCTIIHYIGTRQTWSRQHRSVPYLYDGNSTASFPSASSLPPSLSNGGLPSRARRDDVSSKDTHLICERQDATWQPCSSGSSSSHAWSQSVHLPSSEWSHDGMRPFRGAPVTGDSWHFTFRWCEVGCGKNIKRNDEESYM